MIPALLLAAITIPAAAIYWLGRMHGRAKECEVWHARVREQVARMTVKRELPCMFDATVCADESEYPPLGVLDRNTGFTVFDGGRG